MYYKHFMILRMLFCNLDSKRPDFARKRKGTKFDFQPLKKSHLEIVMVQNLKVFEQKGDLLNFKANIDPMTLLSQVKPS